MRNPMREYIRLNARWVSERRSSHAADVFLPGSWTGDRVSVQEADGNTRPMDDSVTPGAWNRVETIGPVAEARLVAAHPLHIVELQAAPSGERSLAVRVRLAEAGTPPSGLLSLVFTVTAADGRRVGDQDVTVSPRTRDLTMEIPLLEKPGGCLRVKVALSVDEHVLDNACLDVDVYVVK